MLYTEAIKNASAIMIQAHAGQVDKGGYPYVMHPIHLAEQMAFEDEIIVALLHDVAEDHPEYWDLIVDSFDTNVVKALAILNRHSQENSNLTYSQYIKNVATNHLALKIKLADLKHNMDASRLKDGDKYNPKRYIKSYNYLLENSGIDLELEVIDTDSIVRPGKSFDAAYKVEICTPNYRGKIQLAKRGHIVDCSGTLKSIGSEYPERVCNNSGYMSEMARRRLLSVGKTTIKEHYITFKNIEFNRDVKIGITIDFATGKIYGVKLYECICTLGIQPKKFQ